MAEYWYYNNMRLPVFSPVMNAAPPYYFLVVDTTRGIAFIYGVDKVGKIGTSTMGGEYDSGNCVTLGGTDNSNAELVFQGQQYYVALTSTAAATYAGEYPGLNTSTWEHEASTFQQYEITAWDGPVWTNHDLYRYSDGTLFLAASDPTETAPGSSGSTDSGTTTTASGFDLKSWLMGFIVGMRVRSYSVVSSDGSSGGSDSGSGDTNDDTARIRFVEIVSPEDMENIDYDQFDGGDVIMFVSGGDATEILGSSAAQAMIGGD